jgi:hypothetical protein
MSTEPPSGIFRRIWRFFTRDSAAAAAWASVAVSVLGFLALAVGLFQTKKQLSLNFPPSISVSVARDEDKGDAYGISVENTSAFTFEDVSAYVSLYVLRPDGDRLKVVRRLNPYSGKIPELHRATLPPDSPWLIGHEALARLATAQLPALPAEPNNIISTLTVVFVRPADRKKFAYVEPYYVRPMKKGGKDWFGIVPVHEIATPLGSDSDVLARVEVFQAIEKIERYYYGAGESP